MLDDFVATGFVDAVCVWLSKEIRLTPQTRATPTTSINPNFKSFGMIRFSTPIIEHDAA